MGLATWRAVLQESQRCPFTKKPVTVEMVRVCCFVSSLINASMLRYITYIPGSYMEWLLTAAGHYLLVSRSKPCFGKGDCFG